DIDLLLFGNLVIDAPLLTLPHPRLPQRHFVLLPLNDLAAELKHPLLDKTINNLLNALQPAADITRLNEIW
ncbi:MAG: 2-amino-4-hydroxy-6-hydroxymethyldihydropteridine diphosphokinase, partial [Desulfuromusa sp.]|nr:2-amino-4-hydroxy-6-hydroxymethyldihydropteridine diphosphokinase [Desulfuromusa sp.]